ncbi:MAG: hypothetical protein PVJ63_02330 [Thioalkalispiraceae bacterium]
MSRIFAQLIKNQEVIDYLTINDVKNLSISFDELFLATINNNNHLHLWESREIQQGGKS